MSASGSSTITRFALARTSAPARSVSMTCAVCMSVGSRRSKLPGTTVIHLALQRLATSTAAVHALTKLPASSGLPLVKLALPLPPVSTTKTPIVIPSLAIRSPICCCSSGGRRIMPLSSKAVKPVVGHEAELLERILARRVR